MPIVMIFFANEAKIPRICERDMRGGVIYNENIYILNILPTFCIYSHIVLDEVMEFEN